MEKGVAMGLVHTRKVVTTDASNTGWGALCEGKPTFGHWSKTESGFHINCLEMLAFWRACQFFPAGPNRTPCADSLRQHVRGVLYKSPGRCLLEAPLYSGRAPSGMGSAQPALAEGSTPAGQTEPRSRYVISEQCPLRGVDAPSAGGSEDLETFGKAEVYLFASKDNSHCPTYYSKDRDALAHDWPQPPPLCIPPIALLPQVVRRIREQGHKVHWWPPCGRNQPWLSELTQLLTSSSLARAPETGSPLSGERNNMAPSTRAVGSLHLAAQWEAYWLPRASV